MENKLSPIERLSEILNLFNHDINHLNELKISRHGYVLEIEQREKGVAMQVEFAKSGKPNTLGHQQAYLAKAQLALLQLDKEISSIELKKQGELELRDKQRFELEKKTTEASIRASEAAIIASEAASQNAESQKLYNKRTFRISILTVIVLVCQGLIYYLQWRTMQKSDTPQIQYIQQPYQFDKNIYLKDSVKTKYLAPRKDANK